MLGVRREPTAWFWEKYTTLTFNLKKIATSDRIVWKNRCVLKWKFHLWLWWKTTCQIPAGIQCSFKSALLTWGCQGLWSSLQVDLGPLLNLALPAPTWGLWAGLSLPYTVLSHQTRQPVLFPGDSRQTDFLESTTEKYTKKSIVISRENPFSLKRMQADRQTDWCLHACTTEHVRTHASEHLAHMNGLALGKSTSNYFSGKVRISRSYPWRIYPNCFLVWNPFAE